MSFSFSKKRAATRYEKSLVFVDRRIWFEALSFRVDVNVSFATEPLRFGRYPLPPELNAKMLALLRNLTEQSSLALEANCTAAARQKLLALLNGTNGTALENATWSVGDPDDAGNYTYPQVNETWVEMIMEQLLEVRTVVAPER